MFERFVQRTYDALERKDATQLLRTMAEDAVFELSGESRISGRYRGRAEIEAFFGRLFERMERIEPTVERVGFANPLGFNVRNTMYVEWHVTETTKDGLMIAGDVISVFRMRARKCVLLREFWLDDAQLRKAWGLKADLRGAGAGAVSA